MYPIKTRSRALKKELFLTFFPFQSSSSPSLLQKQTVMKTSPSSASIDDEIQRHLSYNTTLTGTEGSCVSKTKSPTCLRIKFKYLGTLLFDYNSIKLKYKNTNLSETISTQIDDKRLEILRPQSSNTPQTTRSNIINQKAVENFDLYDIIQRYGNHPDLLELVLCSKVEEDRRKTAEAKLKQKELEYLIMKKGINTLSLACLLFYIDVCLLSEEQLCRTCNDNRKNTLPNESSTIDKGKSKQDNTTTLDGSHSSSNLILRLAPRNDTSIESQKEESKRKTEQEQDHGYSNKDMDYFSSTSSSYLSPVQLNLSSGPQRKRPSDTNTHTLESPTALEKRKTSSEEPVLQLQSLDYLNSRRMSSNYQQLLPYKSFGEKAITKCSLPTNTLPPIGMSFKTYSSNDLTRNLTQVPSQPAISTSVPSNEYSNQTSWKYRALSTLDSFEASIMETLSFDHHSDASKYKQ